MGVAIDRVSAQPTVAALWLPRNPQHASMYEPARPPKLGSRRWPMHTPKTRSAEESPQLQGLSAHQEIRPGHARSTIEKQVAVKDRFQDLLASWVRRS